MNLDDQRVRQALRKRFALAEFDRAEVEQQAISRVSDSPKTILLRGIEVLREALGDEFVFELRLEGRSSSGPFAWGELVKGDRRLEVHVSRDLGPVRYHVGRVHVSHSAYMRELAVAPRYPSFPGDAVQGFRALAHDLALAQDFPTGDASVLRRAAEREAAEETRRASDSMADYVGDTRARAALRTAFFARRYDEVLALAGSLKYPVRLQPSELRMIGVAQRSVGRC